MLKDNGSSMYKASIYFTIPANILLGWWPQTFIQYWKKTAPDTKIGTVVNNGLENWSENEKAAGLYKILKKASTENASQCEAHSHSLIWIKTAAAVYFKSSAKASKKTEQECLTDMLLSSRMKWFSIRWLEDIHLLLTFFRLLWNIKWIIGLIWKRTKQYISISMHLILEFPLSNLTAAHQRWGSWILRLRLKYYQSDLYADCSNFDSQELCRNIPIPYKRKINSGKRYFSTIHHYTSWLKKRSSAE